jgi:hypothetical protein
MAWIYAFWSFTGHEHTRYWQSAPALMTALEREKKKATGEPILLMGGGTEKGGSKGTYWGRCHQSNDNTYIVIGDLVAYIHRYT